MEEKIVTLDNHNQFLIISEQKIENEKIAIGVKLKGTKYENDFCFFREIKKAQDIYFEKIEDEMLIKLIVNHYIVNNI